MAEEKSYQELQAERAREWAEKQAIAAKQHADLQNRILEMPDVKGAPSATVPYSYPDLLCSRCGAETFTTIKWVTVNGERYRALFRCINCRFQGTWDWATSTWLPTGPAAAPKPAAPSGLVDVHGQPLKSDPV